MYHIAIGLKREDEYMLERILKCFESDYSISKNDKTNSSSLNMTSKKMFDDLQKLNVVQRKSYVNPEIPKIKKKFLHHFIRGIFDGDGHVSKTLFHISLTGNKNTCEYFRLIFGRGYLTHKKDSNITFTFSINGRFRIQNFFSFIYKDATIFLERKYNTFLSLGLTPGKKCVECISRPKQRWDTDSINLLKEIYPSCNTHNILDNFPGWSYNSIKAKACRLGIKKQRE